MRTHAPDKSKSYAEWRAEHGGKPTIRGQFRAELDEIIRQSYTFKEFWRKLERSGYVITRKGASIKYTSIIPPYGKRPIRLESLGAEYTEEEIKQRIIAARYNIRPISNANSPKVYKVKGNIKNAKRIKLKGFKALYFHYLYLFGKIRKNKAPQRVSFLMREELLKMERYQKQFHFLYEHNIETTEGLAALQSKAEADIEELTAERKGLYKLKDDPESDERIKQINSDLKKIVRGCQNVP